jgi:polyferredoxin
MQYPRGLIRNTTENGIAQNLSQSQMLRRILRPRVLVYMAVLSAITMGMLWSLLARDNFKVDVQRDRGSVAHMVGQGMTENVYRMQIMNATEQAQTYAIHLSGLEGARIVPDAVVTVDAASSRWVPVRVQVPPGISAGSHPIAFVISSQVTPSAPSAQVVEKSVFLVPR